MTAIARILWGVSSQLVYFGVWVEDEWEWGLTVLVVLKGALEHAHGCEPERFCVGV